MSRMIWVYRCIDGCPGISASVEKRSIEEMKKYHRKTAGHDGIISLEERSLIEEE